MKNNLRDVHFYDLRIRASKVAAVPPTMSKVIEVMQELVANGEASHLVQHETETLIVKDIYVDPENEAAVLLVARTDPSSPNAVYANPTENTSRVVEKMSGEVGEFGAHVAISLRSESNNEDAYLTLIERVTRVGRQSVESVLNAIVRARCKRDPTTFVCEDRFGKKTREGAPKLIDFRPLFELQGHPSKSFINDLENGTFSSMTLRQDRSDQQIGGRSYLKPKTATLTVSVAKDKIVDRLWDDLKAAIKSESESWDRARIEFTSPQGRPGSAEVDTATGNIIDNEALIHSVRLMDNTWELHNSAETVVRAFADRMINELVALRGPTP